VFVEEKKTAEETRMRWRRDDIAFLCVGLSRINQFEKNQSLVR